MMIEPLKEPFVNQRRDIIDLRKDLVLMFDHVRSLKIISNNDDLRKHDHIHPETMTIFRQSLRNMTSDFASVAVEMHNFLEESCEILEDITDFLEGRTTS